MNLYDPGKFCDGLLCLYFLKMSFVFRIMCIRVCWGGMCICECKYPLSRRGCGISGAGVAGNCAHSAMGTELR